MNLRSLFLCCITLGLSLLGVGKIHAASSPEFLDDVKKYMADRETKEGAEFLDTTFTALKSKAQKTDNIMVRSHLNQLITWMEDEYAVSTLTRKRPTGSWKSGEKVFLTKNGELFEERKSSASSPSSSTSSLLTRTFIPTVQASSPDKKDVYQEDAQSEEITQPVKSSVSKATEYYSLEDSRINITRLQTTWLSRINELRTSRGLDEISLDSALHKTAADWSIVMMEKGVADHKRSPSSAYYAYSEIERWFAKKGVTFTNIQRATFTENIGYAYVRCSSADCTEDAIDGMRAVYNFFRNEEGKAYDAHRRTMIHPLFGVVGLGIAVDETKGIIYYTMHYATEVVRE